MRRLESTRPAGSRSIGEGAALRQEPRRGRREAMRSSPQSLCLAVLEDDGKRPRQHLRFAYHLDLNEGAQRAKRIAHLARAVSTLEHASPACPALRSARANDNAQKQF